MYLVQRVYSNERIKDLGHLVLQFKLANIIMNYEEQFMNHIYLLPVSIVWSII